MKRSKIKAQRVCTLEPTLVIEVPSDGETRSYDKVDKLECYRKIKSLKKYIMIERDRKEKEPTVYVRKAENDKRFVEDILKIGRCFRYFGL